MILLPICEGIEAAMSLAVMIACLCFSASWINLSYSSPSRLPVGAHPRDEKYYEAEIIKCKDGSKSFTRDRLNDNFCDCVDGSDEPGTSACPSGTFYCRTMGSKPKFLFSSRVNDQFCGMCTFSCSPNAYKHPIASSKGIIPRSLNCLTHAIIAYAFFVFGWIFSKGFYYSSICPPKSIKSNFYFLFFYYLKKLILH
ncbi:glucosidase 2 subunit beta isoform X2 [Andrographis paniculata]|uniref:glucosidase 2 subunit beta isoform X2 n=1 Tax=Andrographis paniculata TaxID=175694 RepID=UPI0021E94FFD|nr:glucosidase 2 subunit beta isoform X2 [Andrographis paniculata]